MKNSIKIPGFVSFISSPAGRWLRVIVGLAMIAWGTREATVVGYIVAAIGLIPLAAGAFDVCVLGKIFGGYYNGGKMREALHTQQGVPQLGRKSSTFVKA